MTAGRSVAASDWSCVQPEGHQWLEAGASVVQLEGSRAASICFERAAAVPPLSPFTLGCLPHSCSAGQTHHTARLAASHSLAIPPALQRTPQSVMPTPPAAGAPAILAGPRAPSLSWASCLGRPTPVRVHWLRGCHAPHLQPMSMTASGWVGWRLSRLRLPTMAALLATSMPSSRQAWWWHQLLQVPLAWLLRASAVPLRPLQTHDPSVSAHHSTFMTSLSGPQITGTAPKLLEMISAFTGGLNTF